MSAAATPSALMSEMSAFAAFALAAIASPAFSPVARHAERHPGEVGRGAEAAFAC